MNNRRLTIWCNNEFTAEQQTERDLLAEGVGPHQLLMFASNDDGCDGEAHTALQIAQIAFGAPDSGAVCESASVRWVHLNSAGYTSFDHRDIRQILIKRGTILTNSSDVYAEPCAQHLLAMITSLARGLPTGLDAQRGDRAWRMSLRSTLPLLNGQTVLLLGFGAIARRLVELLRPLEMNVIAVRRNIRGDESIRVATVSELDQLLPTVDHLVNTLPANDQSEGFVNAARLAKLRAGAIVYNIGRGTTLDQDALIRDLSAGRLSAAV